MLRCRLAIATRNTNQITLAYCIGGSWFYLFFSFFFRQKVDRPAPKHRRQLTNCQIFCQIERRFHNRDLNRQPLSWYSGISPPSSGSLKSSRIIFGFTLRWPFPFTINTKFHLDVTKAKTVNDATCPHVDDLARTREERERSRGLLTFFNNGGILTLWDLELAPLDQEGSAPGLSI